VHQSPSRVEIQRRRSERVAQPLAITVRGIDLLGQPFEERTSAHVFNFHGCRYSSKHHLSPNAWITIEVLRFGQPQSARARVTWTQRPQSIRDFFQVGAELESPANLWGVEFPPEDWRAESNCEPQFAPQHPNQAEQFAASPAANSPFRRINEDPVVEIPLNSPFNAVFAPASDEPAGSYQPAPQQNDIQPASPGPTNMPDLPHSQTLRDELQRHAQEAVSAAAARIKEDLRSDLRASVEDVHQQRLATSEEFFRTWKEEFARSQSSASTAAGEQLSGEQEKLLSDLKSKFDERFSEARQLLDELQQKTQTARSEAASAVFSQPEAVAADTHHPITTAWNERIELEMTLAQSQWNELLQASLDRGIKRLTSQVSEHSRDVLQSAERRLADRFDELRKPLAETADDARAMLRDMRAELEEEMSRARGSLVDIEHVAGRIKDYSAQLEASSHDTLNELHRRLENILESQTEHLNRHAETLVGDLTQRLHPAIEGLERQLIERATAEVDAKLSPRLDRVPELIRELSASEAAADESLQLHRDRLRQAGENQQREFGAHASAAVSNMRAEAEKAGEEVLAKWRDELNAAGNRASQSANDALNQSSEWFQQETRSRLQIIAEQAVGTASTNLDDLVSQSAQKHGEDLSQRAAAHLGEVQNIVDQATADAVARSHPKFDDAAQAAAASFGTVLRDISGREVEQFTFAARTSIQDRQRELESSAHQVLANFSYAADSSLDSFRARLGSEAEGSVAHTRAALDAEVVAALDRFAAEGQERQSQWAAGIDQLSLNATAKHEDRLQTAADAWLVSSVRRLNEHGQSTIESLMRVTDQALRDSCSKVFENLAEMMRNRTANAAGMSAFVPIPGHEPAESPTAQ
jgi:hypothetical protein